MSEIKLTFEEPAQRKKTPEHFADWSPEERREKVEALGLPAFLAFLPDEILHEHGREMRLHQARGGRPRVAALERRVADVEARADALRIEIWSLLEHSSHGGCLIFGTEHS